MDRPATTVYGDLLFRLYGAGRDGNLERIDKLRDLIKALEEEYPAECKVWDDHYSRKADGGAGE